MRKIYVIDRNRFTSAGGVGALDMMVDIIARHHGENLSRQVAEWFVHDRIRATADREKLQVRLRTGIRNELVLDCVSLMEHSLEQGESIAVIAGRLGVSVGRLERAFNAELGKGPADTSASCAWSAPAIFSSTPPCRCVRSALSAVTQASLAFVRAFRKTYFKTPKKLRIS